MTFSSKYSSVEKTLSFRDTVEFCLVNPYFKDKILKEKKSCRIN